MPYFEVQLVAYCTVVIEAEDADEAGLYALSCTPIAAYSAEGGEVKGEIKPEDLETAKRHADHVELSV